MVVLNHYFKLISLYPVTTDDLSAICTMRKDSPFPYIDNFAQSSNLTLMYDIPGSCMSINPKPIVARPAIFFGISISYYVYYPELLLLSYKI